MVNNGTCPECTRLQNELGEAIITHVKILGHSQVAAMQQDSRLQATLEPLVSATQERRLQARANFKEHEATHLNDNASLSYDNSRTSQ